MDLNNTSMSGIADFLSQTLNPDPNVRRPAEKFLESIETQHNYGVVLLNLIDKQDIDITVRVAGAIAFKNLIKRNWAPQDSETSPSVKIPDDDREMIKKLIVTLMLRSPNAIQKQLSDAVSIIGKHDFPNKWPFLIDEMVEKFGTGDFHVINGILQTAHSLFKRYRYEFKSQELWEEIKHVLDKMAQPLTTLLVATMELAKQHENNKDALKVIYGSLVLVCKVFLSLNSQDLPEFFEDNMDTWMGAFHSLLTIEVPLLHTGDEEEAGVLEHLRSQICENIGLYAKKYGEEFQPYMETFVTAAWELLVKTSIQTKYDALVSNALTFLSIIAERPQYRQIFEKPAILGNICEKVVIPNLDFRKSDEELFEDSPEEYIRRDIEGSDLDTRRRAACDLVKTLSQNFEAKIFAIFGQYLELLLARYKENPISNWRAKDTAIYMVTSLASRGGTQKLGVTQTSELVPLPAFCAQQIIPELERVNINELPVLKADAIKFIMVFRTLLGQPTLLVCLPHIIRHLTAESVVVHSYAACSIEKILVMRDAGQNSVITAQHLAPYVSDLIGNLFAALTLPGSNENEYVMKAIMRSFSTLQEQTMPFMAVALPRLTEILTVVSKNPSRPHFNHYLFETLSLAIKIVCSKYDSQAVSSFEEALFPVFQNILMQDILEFMPYVFQMLSLLLEIREGTGGISEPYWALFPCLLAPPLWERPGNVTPLIRLLSAFIKQGSQQIVASDKLNAILGVFQKMIASKSNDHEGFYLMQNLLLYYPSESLQPSMKQVFVLLFQRLTLAKTTKYVRGIIVFLSFYAAKWGAVSLIELIDSIQANMFGMVVDRILIPDMAKVTREVDRKIVAIGVTKILTDCPVILQRNYIQFWGRLLQALIEFYELPPDQSSLDGDHFIEVDDTPGYQVAFSQLSFAQPKAQDHFADVVDIRKYLVDSLIKLAETRPGDIPRLISSLGEQHQSAIQKYCEQFGVNIG